MHPGRLDICLSVADLAASLAFYEALGFVPVDGGADRGYVIVAHGQTRIGLYRHDEPNMLNFRGADIRKMAAELTSRGLNVPSVEEEADGSLGLMMRDPDGNLIYFNTLAGHDPAVPDS